MPNSTKKEKTWLKTQWKSLISNNKLLFVTKNPPKRNNGYGKILGTLKNIIN